MTYERFLQTVQRAAGLRDSAEAARLACTTLAVLRECIDDGQCAALAAALPHQLAGCLRGDCHALLGANIDDVCQAVADAAGVPRDEAERGVEAVCIGLAELLGPAIAIFRAPLSHLFDTCPTHISGPRPPVPELRVPGAAPHGGARPARRAPELPL